SEHPAYAGDAPGTRSAAGRLRRRPWRSRPAAASAILQRLPPRAIVAVPLHGLGQAGFETALRCVTEFGADLGVVDGVPAVVRQAVLDEVDVVPVPAGRLEQVAGDLLVRQLAPAADVVDLAGLPARADELDGRAVIVDVQPVAHVEPVAVERDVLAVQQVGDEQRNDFLGVLVRAVVVGAAGHADRYAVGAVVGQRDEVAAGLAGAVRRVRLEDVVLGPRSGLDR